MSAEKELKGIEADLAHMMEDLAELKLRIQGMPIGTVYEAERKMDCLERISSIKKRLTNIMETKN